MKVERMIKKTSIPFLKVLDGIDKFRFKRRIERLKAKIVSKFKSGEITDADKDLYLGEIEKWKNVPSFDKNRTFFTKRSDHMEDIRDIEETIERWMKNSKSRATRYR